MSLPVRTTPEADAQILEVDTWWRTNRLASPNLFLDELTASFDVVSDTPAIGHLYRRSPAPGTRRLLLRRTRYQLYSVLARREAAGERCGVVVSSTTACRCQSPLADIRQISPSSEARPTSTAAPTGHFVDDRDRMATDFRCTETGRIFAPVSRRDDGCQARFPNGKRVKAARVDTSSSPWPMYMCISVLH